MVRGIQAANKAARKAIEATYNGLVTVTEHRKVRDENTSLTDYKDVVVVSNQICKLSYEASPVSVQGSSCVAVSQAVKLFVAPEIAVKAGSKLTVTQGGRTADYMLSGVPAVYPTHQEIMLELFERWA